MTSTTYRKLSISLIGSLLSLSSYAAEWLIEVNNVQSNEGRMMIAVFDSAEQMKQSQPLYTQQTQAATRSSDGKLTFIFTNLMAGNLYAARVFHDVNGDGKLNTNVMGLPQEPFGFSKNVMGSFGPPSFQDCAVTMSNSTLKSSINLK